MISRTDVKSQQPELARNGADLLYHFGVGLAFLGTVRADDGPRLHPICPLITETGPTRLSSPSRSNRSPPGRALRDPLLPTRDNEDAYYLSVASRHGCRVELRSVPRLVHRGTESASQMLIIDRALWRADLFDLIGGEPGNFRRAHYHPSFAYTEPTDRAWDQSLTNDPLSWIVDRLQNLAGTVDDQAEQDVDCDQPAVRRDLEQIPRVISLRLGEACPSPQACLSQTSDVRYVVPARFAQYRSVLHGLDPREDASSWADVVSRRNLTLPAIRRDVSCRWLVACSKPAGSHGHEHGVDDDD